MANILKKINLAYNAHKLAKNPAVKATAAAAAVGIPAVASYQAGKRKGAKKMADVMAVEFLRRNIDENQQIATNYFNKGVQYRRSYNKKGDRMDKQAALDQIRENAFQNEVEKNASAFGGALSGKIKSAINLTAKKARVGIDFLKKNKKTSIPVGAAAGGFVLGSALKD